jgi:hypothetical protein
LFQTAVLTLPQWLCTVALSLCPILVVEIEKRFLRNRAASSGERPLISK